MYPCNKQNNLTVVRPVFGPPKGLPGKIIRLPGGLVHTCRRFSSMCLNHAGKDGVASRAIAICKQKEGDAQHKTAALKDISRPIPARSGEGLSCFRPAP